MLSRISWRACRVAGLSRSFAVPSSHCIVVARRCLPFNHAFSVSPVTVVRASFSTTAGTKQHSSNNYGKRVSDVSDGIHILLESVRRLTSSQAEAYAFLQCLRQFIITKSNMPDNNTTTFATYFSECERSESFALLRWKDIKNIRQLAVEVVSLPSVYEVDCSLFYLQTRHPTSCSIPSYSLNYLYRNGHNTDSAWPTSTPSTSTSSYRPLRLLPSSLSSLLSSLFPSPSSSSPSLQSEANFNNIMHMYRWNPNLQASRIVPTHPYDPWRLRHAVFIDFSSRAMSLTTNTHHILNAIKPMFAGVGAPIVGMEIMVKEFKPTCGILYFATEQAARNALSPWFQAMGSPDFPSSPPMDKVNAKRRKDKLTCVYTSPCVSKTGMFVFSMPKELQYYEDIAKIVNITLRDAYNREALTPQSMALSMFPPTGGFLERHAHNPFYNDIAHLCPKVSEVYFRGETETVVVFSDFLRTLHAYKLLQDTQMVLPGPTLSKPLCCTWVDPSYAKNMDLAAQSRRRKFAPN